jgi:LemA protein
MKTRNLGLIIVVALIVMLGGCVGCGAISFQKKGVALDENVKAKFANVQSEYQRRSDLIPNLVSTVKGEANFESSTLENVIKARASATQVRIDPQNLTPEKVQQFEQAQGQLSQALGRLLVVTENYPTLRANDAFRGLQAQLEGTENRIKVARNDYNESVQEFNTSVRTFPNNIYAGWFGFQPKQPFQAAAGAENAPTVDFNTNSDTTRNR